MSDPNSAIDRLQPDRNFGLLLVAIALPTVATYVYFDLLSGAADATQQLAMGLSKVIQFGLPVIWVIYVRKYWPRWKVGFGQSMLLPGLISGLVIFGAALALYHGWLKNLDIMQVAASEIKEKVTKLGCNTSLAFVGLGAFYVVVHSLMEEYYWRWFVFGMLKEFVSANKAIVISSLGFMSHHVLVLGFYFGWASPATYLLSACVAIGGLMWAWAYERTGKLYGPWLSHAIVDAVIFVIGYHMVFASGAAP